MPPPEGLISSDGEVEGVFGNTHLQFITGLR